MQSIELALWFATRSADNEVCKKEDFKNYIQKLSKNKIKQQQQKLQTKNIFF